VQFDIVRMSGLVKSVLVSGMVSLTMATNDECNGLSMMGLMTLPSDVCLNEAQGGGLSSQMIACDSAGNGNMKMWATADCMGEPLYEMSMDLFGALMGDAFEMVCGGVDCPFAKIVTYDLNGTNQSAITMEDGFQIWQDDDDAFFGSTELSFDSDDDDSGSSSGSGSSSSSEEWMDFIDCDNNEFESWTETAIVLYDCFQFNGTSFYIDYVCHEDGSFDMEYYGNDECSGSPLHSEPHFAGEDGVCPLVNCFGGSPQEDGVSSLDHLVAVGIMLIALVMTAK